MCGFARTKLYVECVGIQSRHESQVGMMEIVMLTCQTISPFGAVHEIVAQPIDNKQGGDDGFFWVSIRTA